MLNDSKVLGLCLELLVRVIAWASHRVHRHLLLLHLLRDLAGSYRITVSIVVLTLELPSGVTYRCRFREGRRKRIEDRKCRGSTS